MSEQSNTFFNAVRHTLTDPRSAMRTIVAYDLPMVVLWQAFAVAVLANTLVAQLFLRMTAPPQFVATSEVDRQFAELLTALFQFYLNPFTMTIVMASTFLVMVFAIHWIARMFKGEAALKDAVGLIAWLQIVTLILSLAQALVSIAIPALGGLTALLVNGLYLFLMTLMVAELYRFTSPMNVFFVIICAGFGILLGLAVVLAIIGSVVGLGVDYV